MKRTKKVWVALLVGSVGCGRLEDDVVTSSPVTQEATASEGRCDVGYLVLLTKEAWKEEQELSEQVRSSETKNSSGYKNRLFWNSLFAQPKAHGRLAVLASSAEGIYGAERLTWPLSGDSLLALTRVAQQARAKVARGPFGGVQGSGGHRTFADLVSAARFAMIGQEAMDVLEAAAKQEQFRELKAKSLLYESPLSAALTHETSLAAESLCHIAIALAPAKGRFRYWWWNKTGEPRPQDENPPQLEDFQEQFWGTGVNVELASADANKACEKAGNATCTPWQVRFYSSRDCEAVGVSEAPNN